MAFEAAFEPDITIGGVVILSGVLSMTVTDPGGAPSANIIDVNTGFHVDVEISQTGFLWSITSGTWVLDLFLEKYGPGADVSLLGSSFTAPIASATGSTTWPFNITAATISGLQGAYRIIAVLTSQTPASTPGPLAAYCEGPILQFH